jgi:hypothetical protein
MQKSNWSMLVKVTLKSGTLVMDGTKLKSGVIEIDMNTITCTDLQGEYADKLVGHLKVMISLV